MNFAIIICGLAAYLLNQLLLKGTQISFFQNHFNDVIAGMLLLALASMIAGKDNPVAKWVASVIGSAVILGFASFAWEVVTPIARSTARADALDVVAYFFGGTIYVAIRETGKINGPKPAGTT